MSDIIYGFHAVQLLLKRTPERIREVFVLKGRKDHRIMVLLQELKEQGTLIHLAKRKCLDKKTDGAVHQGIIVRVKPAKQYQENDLSELITKLDDPFFLILDGITDPYNLGACLRIADAFGVHAVIVPKNHSAPLNSTVKKVACGAAETIPMIRVTNLSRSMRLMQEGNIWIIGTTEKSDHTIYHSKMNSRLALVMGAEDTGLRRLTREQCNELVKIPMVGTVSSLNVSVATGICLFEAMRYRRYRENTPQ